jgi:nicotinamide riboside transporter PnuC
MDHDDQGKTILISIWILNVLALGFLVARLGCKLSTRRGLWWDDWVMILSWVSPKKA